MKVALAVAMMVMPLLAETQPAPKKSFEVASIKPVATRGIANRIMVEGGRFNSPIATVWGLVRWAYRPPAGGPIFYNEHQIIGSPDWLQQDRFAVDARAESEARQVPPEEMQEMVRSLLEDRFQLKAHRETRELPVYDLVVAKSGLKMKLSEDQTPPDPAQQGQRGQRGRGAAAAAPVRGRTTVQVGEAGGEFLVTMSGIAVSIPVLINRLQEGVDRAVVDKTGVTGLYDFSIKFTLPPGPEGTPTDENIFVALLSSIQELGLKLESNKATSSVLVIDSVQKPSEN